MGWNVFLDDEFEAWLDEQSRDLQDEILAHAQLLAHHGPNLGRPFVDSVQGSRFSNMKELRLQWRGEPWRILFAFDPKRRAILLVGGNKQGDKRWYKKNIPIADRRFDKHLRIMEKDNGKKH